MALYHEAASFLTSDSASDGSLRSRVYSAKDLKSSPAHLYALLSEASKWAPVLKEVIENSGLLTLERKVSSRSMIADNTFDNNLLTNRQGTME